MGSNLDSNVEIWFPEMKFVYFLHAAAAAAWL